MSIQPLSKEFVRNSNMRRRVFNLVQMNRYEPCVIYLLRDLLLDVLQRVLPNNIDTHNKVKSLYTGYSHLWITTFSSFTYLTKIDGEYHDALCHVELYKDTTVSVFFLFTNSPQGPTLYKEAIHSVILL